jgi:hypothetical protein
VRIDTIPGDRLINVARRATLDGESVVRSDTLVRAVKIENALDVAASLHSIAFRATADGRVLQSISYDSPRIADRSRALVPLIDAFARNPDNERAHFGTAGFWAGQPYSTGGILKSGASTGMTLEHMVVVAPEPVDAIDVAIVYEARGRVDEIVQMIPVEETHNQSRFILPVRGSWLVVNNWDDLHGHRDSISQEFAIDLVQPFEDGLFPLDRENSDYACYGAEVLAVADGRVAVVKDWCPENPQAGVKAEVDVESVYREHGMKAITAGNYLIIEHNGGEFSFYAHLIRGSIPVREGDHVRQGERIGALGNSGNSDAPHLHFHLMDGAQLGARGLPCHFTNIVNAFGQPCGLIEQNFSTVKTLDESP